MDTFYDRVEQLATHYKMTIPVFLDRCGIPYGTFRSARFRQNAPLLQTVMRILNVCPKVRMEWLVRGKGDMLVPEGPSAEEENVEIARLKKQVEHLTEIILEKERRIIELEMERDASGNVSGQSAQ